MRVLLVARKSLLEILREWQLLVLVVLVPVAFVAIAAFAYGTPMLATQPILVVSADLQSAPAIAALIEELEARRYADGRPVFEITPSADLEAAEAALKERTATALLLITQQAAGSTPSITIKGDALYPRFHRASIILEAAVNGYADRVANRQEIIRLVEEPLVGASPQSEFDLYAPGMIVFALLLIIPQTAMLVGRELRWDTLRRLRLTPIHAGELLGGISLAQMAVAVVLVVVVLASALLMGFHNHGSLWVAMLVGLAISFSAIGLGLITACFVENDGQAINLGSTVSMIQVFLSGSFYQLPPLTVFTLAGHPIDLFDLFPATHGFLALQQVLSYGAGFSDIAFRLAATTILSILYFVVGVFVFQRLKMREQA